MKKLFLLILMLATIFAVGCGSDDIKEPDDLSLNEESENVDDGIFDQLDDVEFCFSSGVGAWGTVITIDDDGSFEGHYSDTNMGETGEEYPNGTRYLCNFSGQFGDAVKVNDYTYSMKIVDIKYENKPGTFIINNGMLFNYTEPYGIANTEELILYLPGAPISELPEEYLSWVNMTFDSQNQKELPFYGLYNASEGEGFSSHKEIDD